MYIYQHMPMGAKTAPLRQGLRYGTRLISWLLSSHFWLSIRSLATAHVDDDKWYDGI